MYNCTWPIETVEESNADFMTSKLGGFHCLGKFKPSSLVMSTNKIFDSKLYWENAIDWKHLQFWRSFSLFLAQ